MKSGLFRTDLYSTNIQLKEIFNLQKIQCYAPTSASFEKYIEIFYEDILTALHSKTTNARIVFGDFNAKVGRRNIADPHNIEDFGLGEKKQRGQILIDFLCEENLLSEHIFQIPIQRK